MSRITSSATKLVLLMVIGSMCAALFMRIIEPALFMGVVGTIVGYYFGASKKQSDDINTNSNGDTI